VVVGREGRKEENEITTYLDAKEAGPAPLFKKKAPIFRHTYTTE
jgi:hypothetical protein